MRHFTSCVENKAIGLILCEMGKMSRFVNLILFWRIDEISVFKFLMFSIRNERLKTVENFQDVTQLIGQPQFEHVFVVSVSSVVSRTF